jgi:hypothetical protein
MIYSDRCAICGEERSGSEPRFLLADNSLEDKLTILHWNEEIASREGIQVACGLDHVEELAILWMTTGRLDYPFTRTAFGARPGGTSPGQTHRLISAVAARSVNSLCTAKVWKD